MSTATLQRLLTASDVAAWLSLTTRRVIQLARRREIPCVILPDGSLVFDAGDLAEWLEARKAAGAAEAEQREPDAAGG